MTDFDHWKVSVNLCKYVWFMTSKIGFVTPKGYIFPSKKRKGSNITFNDVFVSYSSIMSIQEMKVAILEQIQHPFNSLLAIVVRFFPSKDSPKWCSCRPMLYQKEKYATLLYAFNFIPSFSF
jgi:hypothetical protein